MADQAGRVVVISGPGGVGKGTVVAELRVRQPHLQVAVSATTRPRRDGEVDGVHYRFVSRDAFEQMIAAGRFLEWAEFNGNLYGTPWDALTADGTGVVVLEIDVQGARSVRRREQAVGDVDATLVFLAPPSWAALEARLRARGSDDEKGIADRLRIGREEMDASAEFDHVIVNDTVDAAVGALAPILADPRASLAGPHATES